jgi:hypothetical protein
METLIGIGLLVLDYTKRSKKSSPNLRNCTVVCLVPARTDTRWWHDYCIQHEIRFIKGRLKFGGHKNSAPFPSAVIIIKAHGIGGGE